MKEQNYCQLFPFVRRTILDVNNKYDSAYLTIARIKRVAEDGGQVFTFREVGYGRVIVISMVIVIKENYN